MAELRTHQQRWTHVPGLAHYMYPVHATRYDVGLVCDAGLVTEHPLDLSTRIIDSGVADTRVNRMTEEVSDLAEGVAIVESFSHSVLVNTGAGLVAFDTSVEPKGPAVVEAIRSWSTDPVDTIVYTHGHLDHVGGSGAFAADADARGYGAPRVVGHERVAPRFARYRTTSGYNRVINLRQFGGAATDLAKATERPFLPDSVLEPDTTYRDQLVVDIGDTTFEFNHCLGETDDHTWTWIPQHKMIAAGDQFIWMFPNCGNPQKVQRYPLEWAASLREMAAKKPELFVPAHGLPIAGAARIRTCLITVAETLEKLVTEVVDAMNSGAVLDEIVHSIHVDDDVLEIPYLRPAYDEPEFVIRNIWRLYGGWFDGNPARLKPPSDQAVGSELIGLVGNIQVVIDRALQRSTEGDHRLACHLIELAVAAEPESRAVNEARIQIYQARRAIETSLMAKGIYKGAAADSEAAMSGEIPQTNMVLDITS
jgi:alkyl sulfatase BDS1-like metallo-beta-lactamase superfamily hydrolase